MKDFINSMFKNWQPTLVFSSAGGAIATVMGWKHPDGTFNWSAFLIWLVLTIGGAVSKQHNATGGTKPITEEAIKRTTGKAAEPVPIGGPPTQ